MRNLYHFLLSFLGALIYRFPSEKIKVFGVTGTNGKTTTVHILSSILSEAGYSVASTSSVRFEINGEEKINFLKMTMPGRFVIQKFLRDAVNAGCDYAIIEVSSEGVKQHLHRFINFHTAVITNLSKEHIESHGGFEKYKKAKGKFFKAVKERHVLNLDDKYKDYFLSFPAEEKIGYSTKNKEAFLFIEEIKSSASGVFFGEYFLPLKGEFNAYNALAAMAVAFSEGVSKEAVKRALLKVNLVPGRMEEVISSPFRVFVDYAVTPDALSFVYKTLRRDFSPQKMICVLGACGGGRDKWKRPLLGEIANEMCDKVIVTNEDPYDEDEESIISEVAPSGAEKIVDRKKAIERAVELAETGDLVIITGKGSEVWMCLANGEKIPWSDRDMVKEAFDNKGK